jgi:hypothetical protein
VKDAVVIVAREAGAAAALAPVARMLISSPNLRPVIIASDEGGRAFERQGLPVLGFPDDPDLRQIDSLLRRERAAVLLTGTSVYPDRDGRWWSAGARRDIPSLALVDHWCNYAERFSFQEPFDCLPTTVAVIDAAAADGLRSAGFPAPVVITGHPYFDELIAAGAARDDDRHAGRLELGVDEERLMLVFASEPQASHFGTSLNHLGHGRYTERQVAQTVLAACAGVAPEALVVIKLHPLEDSHAFDDVGEGAGLPETKVLRSYPSPRLIAAADVVVGMTSMFLLESALMGVPTISVRPGGEDDDHPWIHEGLIDSVVDPSGVTDAVRKGFADTSVRPPRAGVASFGEGATERMCELVRELASVGAGAR